MTQTRAAVRRNSGKSPDSKEIRTGVVYARVAVDRPDGLGLQRQVAACQQIAAQHGITVAGVYADNGVSAHRQQRPQYQQMLEDLRSVRPDTLITWNVDRLSRRPADLAELVDLLEETGTKLYTADGPSDTLTPVDSFLLRMQVSIREYESKQASERAKAASARRKAASK